MDVSIFYIIISNRINESYQVDVITKKTKTRLVTIKILIPGIIDKGGMFILNERHKENDVFEMSRTIYFCTQHSFIFFFINNMCL